MNRLRMIGGLNALRGLTAALLLGGLSTAALPAAARPATDYASVDATSPLTLPRDYGSHNEFRTEWWYVTGWLHTATGEALGFQVTFFRSKPDIPAGNPSAFTPQQILIAHAAISDPRHGRLWQDQRVRRAGLGLAEAAVGETRVWIDDWSLAQDRTGYSAQIAAADFGLELKLTPTQSPMLNGQAGVSRKGPSPKAASYYYSEPHLAVTGTVARAGKSVAATGEAWLDHEWSSDYLDGEAMGWDWIGINLDDGSALMAFRIRGPNDSTLWAGGSLRSRDGQVSIEDTTAVHFTPERRWLSPRTGIEYPVEWRVSVGGRQVRLVPLMDDQENDTRLSTGAIYWEGAVSAFDGDKAVGRGYLELTGYGDRLRLR